MLKGDPKVRADALQRLPSPRRRVSQLEGCLAPPCLEGSAFRAAIVCVFS